MSGKEFSGRVTQLRVIRSEWTKLYTLRSTRYSLLASLIASIGFACIAAAVVSHHWPQMQPREKANFDPFRLSLFGVMIAQLAIGVLGVMTMTGEYTTGMIRSTFCAVPKRLPVLWGKMTVFGLVSYALMLPTVFLAFLLSQTILSGRHINIALSHHGVVPALCGTALYLALVGLFGLAIGTIIRNTAGGITTVAAILFVIPPLMNVLPASWNNAISPYLPSNAGSAIMQLHRDSGSLAPWTGLGVFACYVAVGTVIAAVLLKRRDV